ncbi:MAG: hypothetical protein M3N54_15695 [Acidobacteriota bacterium]|nr:hypothetical protein [Acidobacteriota bacterium]
MTTRLSRRAFVTGLGFTAATYGWARDFWNDKKPADWTEDEIQQMLTRSPWAREASIFDSATHKGVSSAPYAGGIYGSRRYESPDGKSLPTVRGLKGWGAIVRWESALPVREAMKAAKLADAEKNYIIALIGEIPAASVPSEDDDGAERQRKLDVLKESTRLERRDDPLELQRVKIAPRTPLSPSGTFYYFSRMLPITAEDKQVTFVTKVGPLEVKCKFTLRDMFYHGSLEL